MRFWDSSAVVPLLVSQAQTPNSVQLFGADPELVVWWAARVECVSAITRLEREGALTAEGTSRALLRLHELAKIWDEVQPADRLRRVAERSLRVHTLRSADALQLAAMLELGGERPQELEVVCFDERLSAAAAREGLKVIDG